MGSPGHLDTHVDPHIQAIIVKAAFGSRHDLQLADGRLPVFDRGMHPVGCLYPHPLDRPRKALIESGGRHLSILEEYSLMVADHEPEVRIALLQLYHLLRLGHLQLPVIIPCNLLSDNANGLFIGIFQLRIDDPEPGNEKDEEKNKKKGLQDDQAFYQSPA